MGRKLLKNATPEEKLYTHLFYQQMGIQLEHSQPIGTGFANTQIKKQGGRVKGDDVMRKGIQHARWWFAYLRLALELEEKKVEIVVKPSGSLRSVPSGTKKEASALFIPRETTFVEVERDHYTEWDLDQIFSMSFDDWWKSHRDLFQSALPKIVVSDDAVADDRHLLLQIDRTAPMTQTMSALRKLLSNKMDQKMDYEIEGQVRVPQLTSRFNAVVCALKGMSPKEIMTDEKAFIRAPNGVPFSSSGGKYNYSSEFRKYYKGGIFHILEVSKGRFGKGYGTGFATS
jgi:hypothetical protein